MALCCSCSSPVHGAAAQGVADHPPENAAQLTDRKPVRPARRVSHETLVSEAVQTYGPSLSKRSLGGQDDVMRELISNGTPNMPVKYSLEPNKVGEVVRISRRSRRSRAPLSTTPAPH